MVRSRLTEISSHLQNELGDADWTTKREIIRALVQRIEIGQKKVALVLRPPTDTSGRVLDPIMVTLSRREGVCQSPTVFNISGLSSGFGAQVRRKILSMNLQPSNSILAGATVSGDFLVKTQAVVVVLGMNSNHELDRFLKSCNLLILQSRSSRQKPQRQSPATKSVQNTFRLNRSGASLLHSSVNLRSR